MALILFVRLRVRRLSKTPRQSEGFEHHAAIHFRRAALSFREGDWHLAHPASEGQRPIQRLHLECVAIARECVERQAGDC
jgi:hypothetical protein